MSRYSSTYKPGQVEPGELGTRSRQQGKDLQPAQVLREPVCPARKENRVPLGKSVHPKNPLHPLCLCGWCLGLSLEHHPSRAGKPGIRAGIWGAEGFLQGQGWERGTRDPESWSDFCSEMRGADKEITRCPRRDGVSSAAGLWPWAVDTGSLQPPACALGHEALEVKLRPVGREKSSSAHRELPAQRCGWGLWGGRGVLSCRHRVLGPGRASPLCLWRIPGERQERGRDG